MNTSKRQTGMSFITLVIVLGFVAYNIYVGIKLVPEYMEFQSVKSSVDNLAAEIAGRPIQKAQAVGLLNKKLSVAYVDINTLLPSSKNVNAKKTKKPEVFHYKREKKSLEVGVHYEKRVPLFANVEVLLDFEHIKTVPSTL